MLEIYYYNLYRIDQLRASFCQPFLDGFSEELKKNHYATRTARGFLRAAAHLGAFLQTKEIGLDTVDEDVFQEFVAHLPQCHCPCQGATGGRVGDVVRGAKLFLRFLQATEFPDLSTFEKEVVPEPELVKSFIHWLKHHQGLSQTALRIYGQAARKLVDALGQDPAAYTAKPLRTFLFGQTKEMSPGSVPGLLQGVRKFLRYLSHINKCVRGLERAIPAVASWRSASLPSYLSRLELDRLIDACETTSQMGARDRVVILLLARLGLRAGDAASLCWSKIDWNDGSFLISGKGRREVRFPLTQEIGDALIGYLKQRPQVEHDRVFLRISAPFTPLPSGGISQIVTRRMRKAKIVSSHYGAHILRHTAATEMLREGSSLYEIGKVLRHRSVDTTAIYAKVDFQTLKQVALPWPEVL